MNTQTSHPTLESIIYDALDDGEVRSPSERCAKCKHIARLYGVRVPCDGEPVCALAEFDRTPKGGHGDADWKRVCAACAEGTTPERCAYYGEPNGCNAPTLGKHPDGDLTERLQEALEKAERRIAELERAFGDAAAMRAALEAVLEKLLECAPTAELEWPELVERARAALAAPARNCDTNMKDASATWNAYKMSAPCPPGGWDEGDLFDWLFAPAEGGSHA